MLTKWPTNWFHVLKVATDISAKAASSEGNEQTEDRNWGRQAWVPGAQASFLTAYWEDQAHLQVVPKQLPGNKSYPVWKGWWRAIVTSVLKRDSVEMLLDFRSRTKETSIHVCPLYALHKSCISNRSSIEHERKELLPAAWIYEEDTG